MTTRKRTVSMGNYVTEDKKDMTLEERVSYLEKKLQEREETIQLMKKDILKSCDEKVMLIGKIHELMYNSIPESDNNLTE